MPWPFDRQYMQLALAAGLIVGATAPLIGCFLVQRRLSLLGDGIGHVAFAGVAAGLLTGVWPVWTALVAAIVAAVAIDRLRTSPTTGGDLALALFFYGGIAMGVVLASAAGALNANLFSYLFGSILTVDPSELAVVAVIGAVVIGAVVALRGPLFALAVDEEWSTVAGLPSRALGTLVAVLAAVTVVAAMRIVGILLVASLLALPVAGAQLLARSFRSTMAWSVVVGCASVVVGLVLARAWSLAPGGTIVLVSCALFGGIAVATRA